MSETRTLAAILIADIGGYSRLAGTDEDRTLARLRRLRCDFSDPAIATHYRPLEGRLIEFRVGVHFGEMVDEKSGNPSGAARVPEE